MANEKRHDTFGFKMAETWFDATYQTQERGSKLGEAYIKAFQEGQKTSFDLALAWMKQLQELQALSFDYLQELARTSNETLTGFLRAQDEVRQDVKTRFDQQVTEIEKVAKAAAK